ncbi:MAG: coproporphyrinogen III oxidase family protein, partial [Deltaproteobacteria bacterium]
LRDDYLGFGAGAHSFMKESGFGARWKNRDDLQEYSQSVKEGVLPWRERDFLSSREAMEERLFLGLRMLEGVSLEDFRSEFGVSVHEAYPRESASLLGNGLIEIRDGRLRIVGKKLIIANQIFMAFL